MQRLTLRVAAVAAAALAAPPALAASEIVASLGVDDLRGDRVAAAGLELRTGALWSRSRFDLGLGAAFAIDDDFWAGAGPVLTIGLAPRWRLETSVMLGSYVDGGGNDLGTDFPIFRSMLGASYALGAAWRVGASIDHKSNARTANRNPGVETFLVSITRSF